MEPPSKKPKIDTGGGVFTGITAYIVPTGIGKARCSLFTKQIQKHDGNTTDTYSLFTDITHIIVDESMQYDRLLRILKTDTIPEETIVVKSLWLSNCIKQKTLAPTKEFELEKPKEKIIPKKQSSAEKLNSILAANPTNLSDVKKSDNITVSDSTENNEKDNKKSTDEGTSAEGQLTETNKTEDLFRFKAAVRDGDNSDPDSDYQPSDHDDDDDGVKQPSTSTTFTHRPLPKGNWVCSQASGSAQPNLNKHITDKLQAMAKTYENTNDKWRALGYQKAIAVLKKQPKQITTWEEAKSLPGVGAKLADKIWEIAESGELQKLNEMSSREEMKTLDLFTGIWGAGAQTARMWIQQGFKTLDDLRTKANLTRHQKIGLKYYDDLAERMSREEAGQIESVVKTAALELNPGLIAMACGSYRRGKTTCGDVDVLVTHPDGRSHKGIFQKLLHKLRTQGFLTDDLVTQEENGAQCKYLGVCKLPGEDSKHRRLDIIVVPYDEFACALMYFTGSAHFNRSMRNLAGKMGMSLSEHSLNVGVVRRKGEKLNKGTPLPTPTEESVFQHLGLKYREPTERDH